MLRMCFQGALNSIPTGGLLHHAPVDEVFQTLSKIAVTPPAFEAEDITGVPFYALFIDFLDTRFGQAFFTNPVVNHHLKNIFNDYQTMLSS